MYFGDNQIGSLLEFSHRERLIWSNKSDQVVRRLLLLKACRFGRAYVHPSVDLPGISRHNLAGKFSGEFHRDCRLSNASWPNYYY
jgi:hypothetical protein